VEGRIVAPNLTLAIGLIFIFGYCKVYILGGLYGRTYNAQEGVQKSSSKDPERKKGRKEKQKEIFNFDNP